MQTKDSIQAEALSAWLASGKRGTVVLPTGVGKTRLGRLAADAVGGRVAVVTSRIPILDSWKTELGREADLLIINSACKTEIEVDILIIDEVHKALSPKFSKVFESIKYKYLLCLTASLPREEEKLELLFKYAPLVHHKTVEQTKDVMAPFQVINLEVPLSKDIKAKYTYFNNAFKEAAINVAKLKKAEYGEKSIFDVARERAKSNDDSLLTMWSKKYWSYMSLRKSVLYNNRAKVAVVSDLVKKHKGAKIIVFTKTIELAEVIGAALGVDIYHSILTTKEREYILANRGDVLVTVDALNEGIDFQDMEIGISASGVSTEIEQIQRLGRIARQYKNKSSTFYNLYVKDTPEERWVRDKTKNLNVTYMVA